jgi:phospholipid-binding lipoprotein MlaA
MGSRFIHRFIAGIFAVTLMSTAVAQNNNDPLEPINRAIFFFNQMTFGLYIKPAARAYDKLLPLPVKDSVHNFIINMRMPRYFVNNALQGKAAQAANCVARFVLNSTLGIFGLFDVAADMGLPIYPESFGNTFYKWGWNNSSYLVVPLVGPSTIRDGIGLFGDFLLNPPTYFQPKWRDNYYILVLIEEHHDAKDVEDLMAIAGVNDYDLMRSSYLQYRNYYLSGGIVPDSDDQGYYLLGEPPS